MPDKSMDRRVTDSILYFVYPLVEKALRDAGKWKDTLRRGNTGNPRQFFVADNNEAYILFQINVVDSTTATIEIKYDECEQVGIGKETAEAIVEEALASALRRKGA